MTTEQRRSESMTAEPAVAVASVEPDDPAPAPAEPRLRAVPATAPGTVSIPGSASTAAMGVEPAARAAAGVAPRPGAKPAVKPAAKAGGRPAGEKRRPLHLGAVVGISAGVYAVSLAGVTGLQSSHDRALVSDAQPATSGVAALRAAHDRLTSDLQRASQDYTAAASGYQQLATEVGKLDRQVAGLAGSVQGISSGTQSLSGGSGGGLSSIYVSSGGLPSVAAAPRPATAPAVNACTTPSGKPC